MTEPDFSALAELHTMQGQPMPRIATELARGAGAEPELVWRNDLGGLTFRVGQRYLKWNLPTTGIDLERERVRLEWIAARHPAPRVVDHGVDGDAQWLLTEAVPGEVAVGDAWRARRSEAIQALADGLHAIHAIPIHDFPTAWAEDVWVGRAPEALGERPPLHGAPVLVHGDACAPNTLITQAGTWSGNVDFGDLGVGRPLGGSCRRIA